MDKIYDKYNKNNSYLVEGFGWIDKKTLNKMLNENNSITVLMRSIKYYFIILFEDFTYHIEEGFEDFTKERFDKLYEDKKVNDYNWELRKYRKNKTDRKKTESITLGNFNCYSSLVGKKSEIKKLIELKELNFIKNDYEVSIWKS